MNNKKCQIIYIDCNDTIQTKEVDSFEVNDGCIWWRGVELSICIPLHRLLEASRPIIKNPDVPFQEAENETRKEEEK